MDFSLSRLEFSGIGRSSNSARLNSVEGSPSGPLTGSKLSPVHESKKRKASMDRRKVLLNEIRSEYKKISRENSEKKY